MTAQRKLMLLEMAYKLGAEAGRRVAGKQGEELDAALNEHLAPAFRKASQRRLDAAAVLEGFTHATWGTVSVAEVSAWGARLASTYADDTVMRRAFDDLVREERETRPGPDEAGP